ncbi:MAG: alpha/beta hydrolase family protein [Flavisolibacter sp.]
MKKLFKLSFVCLFLAGTLAQAQDVSYQTPPKDIADLLLAKPTPGVSLLGEGSWILLSERNSFPDVEELGQPEMKIAGMRLNPANYSPSRQNFINNFRLKNLKTGKEFAVTGLPANLLATNVSRSPNEMKIAFLNNTGSTVDLYVVDVATQKAHKVNKQPVNSTLGGAVFWVDNNTIIYKAAAKPVSAAPKKSITPKGPAVQENVGKAAPMPTYQDLIKSPYDEELFQFYTTSQLVMNKNGVETKIGSPAIYSTVSLSPDKKFILTRTLHKPFSYLVTANGFPGTWKIMDLNGKLVKQLFDLPSSEGTPSGYDNTQNVPRGFDWRDDEPATVTWVMPLDSGLIRKDVPFHDAIYALSAPFTSAPKELFKTTMRFRNVQWGNSNLALVMEGLRSKQMMRVSLYNPATGQVEKLYDLSQNDAYNNPGQPVTRKNQFGREVIFTVDNGTKLLLNNGTGASPKGDYPFLAKYDLNTKTNDIIWRAAEGTYESVVDVIDPENLVLLTRKETSTDVPNYYIKNLKLKKADVAVTNFSNPYPQLDGVSKEKIFYKRADGVDLTGNLYLPKGYNKDKDGPLPVIMWAYPREFNSANDAAQVRGSQNRFITINYGSPIFYVTQGYAVLDAAEMPIVAKEGQKPNDNFVEQLRLNAEAAINKLVDMGVGDRNRMAVGGHSYGAFMTANLLAHTDLFKAGIARSGAYNRTLTPFGFQNEDRTYWQAPELYFEMSPFSYANQIKTPLLLIHGEADDNTGTYPINSERLFNAVKGHGGTVRLVMLPYEAHGYRGKENLLHVLWEQYNWLERFVKNPPKGNM